MKAQGSASKDADNPGGTWIEDHHLFQIDLYSTFSQQMDSFHTISNLLQWLYGAPKIGDTPSHHPCYSRMFPSKPSSYWVSRFMEIPHIFQPPPVIPTADAQGRFMRLAPHELLGAAFGLVIPYLGIRQATGRRRTQKKRSTRPKKAMCPCPANSCLR